MTSTLGAKLAPKIPPFFSEVVYSRREADKFYWSNITANVDLKKRALPFSDKLEPTFVPVVEAYKQRLNIIAAQQHAAMKGAQRSPKK